MGRETSEGPRPIEAFRSYLRLLAGAQVGVRLRRYVDPSDIVQQTLMEAHRAEENFRGTTVAQQMAWLRKILANNLADELRRLRRQRRDIRREESIEHLIEQSSFRIEAWIADEGLTPAGQADLSEDTLRLTEAIGELPDDQQEAVVFRHLHAMPLKDIAEHMEKSETAVASLVYRGLTELRRRLRERD